ncbi:hypothetical protein VNO77_38991 [Canavalia gladiata]|uniref:Uncharacterized protein n=1 Tax=Canavalia gladiata TaxID=3824 RepID=A0AAN9PVF1_CANGL
MGDAPGKEERIGTPCIFIHEANQQQAASMVDIKEKILGREELWIFFEGINFTMHLSSTPISSHEVVDLYSIRNVEFSILDSFVPIQKLVSLEVMGGIVYGVVGCYDKEDELFCSLVGFFSRADAPVSSSKCSKVLSTKARLHWCQKEIVSMTNCFSYTRTDLDQTLKLGLVGFLPSRSYRRTSKEESIMERLEIENEVKVWTKASTVTNQVDIISPSTIVVTLGLLR